MDITKKELETFCQGIQTLKAEKKEKADEIKARIEALACSKELTKKSISKFIKEWEEAQKNKEDYVLVDFESDALLLIAMPELNSSVEES